MRVSELLPSLAELVSTPTSAASHSKPPEININLKGETRCDELEVLPLNGFRGLSIGRLLLHDVTEQRRYQTQLLEQQRALAMLNQGG